MLGTDESAKLATASLPDLVRRYAEAYPDVEIRLVEATSDVQIPAVVAGERHAGIIIPPPDRALPEPLAYRRLVSEPLVAAAPAAWVEDGRLPIVGGALAPEALLDAPLILFPRTVAPAFHDLVTGYFSARGQPARIVQEAIQMQTIISLVSAGLGLALVAATRCGTWRGRAWPMSSSQLAPGAGDRAGLAAGRRSATLRGLLGLVGV